MAVNIIIATILAIIMGQIINHLNGKLIKVVNEEITYKEYYSTLFQNFKIDYIWSSIFVVIFNLLMHFVGNTLMFYLYSAVISITSIAFYIDFKIQLIPDEVDIVLVVLALINIFTDFHNIKDYIFGLLVGGGIFLAISLFALLIYKKEGMGFGDVKLMAALGLFFGLKKILVITLVSFATGAIIGILLMLLKKKEGESYIAFGPFIVLASWLIIFVSPDVIIDLYFNFCSWLGTGTVDIIYNLFN